MSDEQFSFILDISAEGQCVGVGVLWGRAMILWIARGSCLRSCLTWWAVVSIGETDGCWVVYGIGAEIVILSSGNGRSIYGIKL